jgi:tetratricopeptide (TPR) repeat protein
VSKAQIIRKKALDLVRDQDWPNAIKEYRRLVELDQTNPNLHNELADLFLKTNQKAEAYDAFVRAVDEYNRVGLFNNAVAVCKKVLRVLPARHEVLVKLGYIRNRQGLAREAESYYAQFFDKAAAGVFTGEVFQKLARPILDDVGDSSAMLERLAQAFIAHGLHEDAGDALAKLVALCEKNGDGGAGARARAELERIGMSVKLAAQGAPTVSDRGTVITEANLWTQSHSEGERIEVDTAPRTTPTGSPAAPAPQPAGAAPGGPSERDLYLLRLARGSADVRRPASAAAAPAHDAPASAQNAPAPAPDAVETSANVATAEPEAPPRLDAAPATRAGGHHAPPSGSNGTGLQVSALLDDESGAAGSDTDYRSHYDLGMAYIEMDLHTEAIREYQVAAKSPQYQVKCLEMIGLCFIKQNQPQLAIRQLTKGLSLIGSESEESLGIKYNLGLAHEMIGDLANARTYFEDVYVVDVTFRDVSEKVRRLAGTS